MTLDVDKEKMMIMGVIFDNKRFLRASGLLLATNMIEGWHPTVEDVERLREKWPFWKVQTRMICF